MKFNTLKQSRSDINRETIQSDIDHFIWSIDKMLSRGTYHKYIYIINQRNDKSIGFLFNFMHIQYSNIGYFFSYSNNIDNKHEEFLGNYFFDLLKTYASILETNNGVSNIFAKQRAIKEVNTKYGDLYSYYLSNRYKNSWSRYSILESDNNHEIMK